VAKNINFMFALLLVVAFAWIALAARGCAEPRIPVFMDPKLTLDEAQTRGADSGKPVFALVGADWCEYCGSLKRHAMRNSTLVAWLKDNTVPVYVDVSRYSRRDPDTLELMGRLQIQSLPAMILLDKGAQTAHLEGDWPASDVLAWLKDGKVPAGAGGAP
jgi:thiol:disulfide interchange protein